MYLKGDAPPMITKQPFGQAFKKPATLYTLTNKSGASVSISSYGGILVSLRVPDRDGVLGDVLLGCDDASGYVPTNGYVGALIGRVGNRIGGGNCVVSGQFLALAKNDNGINHLHGGAIGFNEKHWQVEEQPNEGYDSLVLSTVSPDEEEGYPGTLTVRVTYTWTDCGKLIIHYEAVSDKDTLCNLTNHAYFNLNGEGSGSIEDHIMTIHADHFTPVTYSLIPTGEIRPVEGTPFDLRKGVVIGDNIHSDDEQMRFGGGFDHNFCLNGQGMRLCARVEAPQTGRVMEVSTDLPGIQFYAGNMLDGGMIGKCGRPYQPRDGFCLETQTYPDAVHHPHFPSCVLKAGEKYDTRTVYAFSCL